MRTLRAPLILSLFSGLFVCPLFADQGSFDDAAIKAAAQRIDELVVQACEANGVALNDSIDDETFLRRVYLDLVGRVPTISEAREFLGSDYVAKRDRLIEELLDSEGRVSHAYNYWADVLRVNDNLGNNGRSNEAAYRLWIKDALRQNKPYDQIVFELVTAEGHLWENGAIGYYQRDRGMPLDNMANTVRIFLGTRLECAQCHNHPFDQWTQMDFFQMAAFSHGMEGNRYESPNRRALTSESRRRGAGSGMRGEDMLELRRKLEERFGGDREAMRAAAREEIAKMRREAEGEGEGTQPERRDAESMRYVLNELYRPLRYTTVQSSDKPLKLPHDYEYDDAKPEDVVAAATMFGNPAEVSDGVSRIESYGKWMTSPENPTFTKVIVNRLWKQMFGLALIEPFDDLTEQSVSSSPELLAYLESLMRDLRYDMRGLTRVIASTEAYQRAATTEELELGMPYYFQGPLLRRLSAEQVWDSTLTLLVEDIDSFKPSVKQDIARIEEQKQIYESLEGIPFGEYREMVDRLSTLIREDSQRVEEKRRAAVAARNEGDEAKARELSMEVRNAQRSLERTMRSEAFGRLSRGADEDELMQLFGITKEVLAESVFEEARLARPQEEMTRQERRAMASERRPQRARGGARPGELGTMARASEFTARPGSFLRTFGQSDREVIENASDEASVPQALALLNGPLSAALSGPYSVLGRELEAATSPEEKIEAIYTAMLSRKPTSAEAARLFEEVSRNGEEAYEDIVWAVLNGSQFLFIQ